MFARYNNIFVNSLCSLRKKLRTYPTASIGSYNGTNDTIDILNIATKQPVYGSYATASFLSSFDNFAFGLDQLLSPLNTDEQLPSDTETIGLVAGEASSTSRYAIDLLGWSAYFAYKKDIPSVSIEAGLAFARDNPDIDVYVSAVRSLPDDLPSNIYASESLLEKFLESEENHVVRYKIVDGILIVYTDSDNSLKTGVDSLNALGGKIDLTQDHGVVDMNFVYNWAECIFRSVNG